MTRTLQLSDLTIEVVPIDSVHEHPQNVRQGDVDVIADSLQLHGQYVPIVVQASTGAIVKGNHTHRAAALIGMDTIAVVRVDVDDDQALRMMLVDNVASDKAGFDDRGLAGLLMSLNGDLAGTGYVQDDLAQLVASLAGDLPIPEGYKSGVPLADRFIAAPVSILNARSLTWRDRKQAWGERGMLDSGGRAKSLALKGAGARTGSDYYAHRDRINEIVGRELSAEELVEYLRHMESGQLSKTGTSAFDPVLAEVLLSWYSPAGDGSVVDPFAGGPTRGLMSTALGRRYVGVDLSADQVTYNQLRAIELGHVDPQPLWVRGDSTRAEAWDQVDALHPDTFDMLLTCPPYADLEEYSDDPADLSNVGHGGWDVGQAVALQHACSRLIPGGFACVVIGEARGGKSGGLYGLVGDTQRHLQAAGCEMWAHYILLTPVSGAALVAAKTFGASRSPVRVHQHVLVARRAGGERRVADQWGLLTGVDDLLAAIVVDDTETPE